MVILKRSSLVILACGCFLLANCSQSKPAETAKDQSGAIAAVAKLGNLATDPFAQMSFAFEGNPSAEDIKPRVERVMQMYGMELTDANRSHVGNTLVTLRKEHGHSEMEILDKLAESPANGDFEQAAAAVSETLSQ